MNLSLGLHVAVADEDVEFAVGHDIHGLERLPVSW